ncbi:hypothetical protein MBLNU230_g5100t1 [Neophaeotheca triangularis]
MLLRHGFIARSLARQWPRSHATAATSAVKKPRGRPRKADDRDDNATPRQSGWEDALEASLSKELRIAKKQTEKKQKKEDKKEQDEEAQPGKKRAQKAPKSSTSTKATKKPAKKAAKSAPTSPPTSKKPPTPEPRLSALTNTRNHHDLPSFLAHAAQNSLSKTSSVYRGTHYEYTVQSSLAAFNLSLQRTGRSNDLGIDLIGTWELPSEQTMQVLVQCKAARPLPSMVRELEGAYAGAPAGWRGQGVLALLVLDRAATKGVREALQRSQWPMGVLVVGRQGAVKGFVWNAVAEERGLAGLGVTVKYVEAEKAVEVGSEDGGVGSEPGKFERNITLTWMGQPWVAGGVA